MTRSSSRPVGPAFALLAGLAVSAAVATPAHAATSSRTDPAGDVVRYDASGVPTTVAGTRNGDVVRRTYSHTSTVVKVRVAYRDLARAGSQVALSGTITTSTGKTRVFQAFATPDYWPGSHYLTDPRGMPVTCSGMRHTFDYTDNVATVTVPRSCLGKPAWVRIGVQHTWFDTQGVEYADDAGRAGWSETDVATSGRIAVG
jgi:hypothetical protein